VSIRNLILILGDQLTPDISSLKNADKDRDVILMCEVGDEACYVPHHKKKIAFLFSAMRHFAEELKDAGWTVRYVKLTDDSNSNSFSGELTRATKELSPEKVVVTEPGEWRVLKSLRGWGAQADYAFEIRPDDRFLCTHDEFENWATNRKTLRMEHFYREMRVRTGLLMEGDDPAGGKWNYDSENRKPASDDLFIPKRIKFKPDDITKDVLELVEERFPDSFGKLENFWFACTRADAEKALDHFIEDALHDFGDYQDAMLEAHKFLYHSLLSTYINSGLLDPFEVCKRAERAYLDGKAPLNAVEGFIRQIIGWREFIRGIYWMQGEHYVQRNELDAHRPLPAYFWTGDTQMACMKAVITQTIDEAYAHHIQRLMVTGNFALIAGLSPHEVHEWYLAVYADAFEWVEAPNVIGMSLFADGGVFASKPYASSGSYIHKMSDYCENCQYSVSKKTGENACPFNSLYWHFLIRNKERFSRNGRVNRAYATWDRMDADKRSEYLKTAEHYLDSIETL
tara:strand:- start:17918 stop:19453 length:1536 start_codon:yes stop_codon:yes gene_type:complete